MAQKSERSTTVEGSSGGLLPAVEGHSLGTRYKVQGTSILMISMTVVANTSGFERKQSSTPTISH